MVGTGKQCDPGDWLPRKAICPGCGHSILLYKSGCGLVECPRCSRRWARRAAERAAARTFGAFSARISKHKPRHITFEIPWWTGAPDDWDKIKDYALNTVLATGGVLVVHPWRIRDDVQRLWEQERDKQHTQLGRYEWTKEKFGMSGFEWGPHCHALAYGRFADVPEGTETFLYRNIRRVNTLSGMEGVITYLMTHTFAPRGKEQVYRYFGICSPQKLKPTWTGEVSDPMRCEHCGKMMVEEGTNELVMHKHYITAGWHIVTTPFRKARGAPPPRASRVPSMGPDPFQKWAST
jgi:ribosomal protein S27E